MARILVSVSLLLAAIAGGAAVFTLGGCEFANVKDPESKADDPASHCPKVPDAPPYAKLTVAGLDLENPSPEKPIKDDKGKVVGTLAVDLSRQKDGIVRVLLDFGTMALGATRSHTFKIQNAGDANLEVVKHASTCECTVAGVGSSGLKKGESTEIKLEWTPKSPSPEFQQTAEICTNDPKRKVIAFAVSGQVAQNVEIYPPGSWRVGELRGDDQGVASGYIISRVQDDFKILDLEYPKNALKIETKKMKPEDMKEEAALIGGMPKSAYKVTATVLAGDDVGQFNHKVAVKTNLKDNSNFNLYVVGSRAGPIQIRPTPGVRYLPSRMLVQMGNVSAKKGGSAAVRVYVRGLKEKSLKIESQENEPDYLQVNLKPVKRSSESKEAKAATNDAKDSQVKEYELNFTVPPYPADRPLDAFTERRPAKVVLKTNHPKARTITFSLQFNPRDDR